MRLIASFVLLLATAFAQAALAQDPPTRVGRLAFTEGRVALFQDPDQGWEKAYLNSPVTSENSIWTDPSSRAEMRVSGIAVRLDETTQVDIVKLDEDVLRAFVTQGAVAVRVRHLASDDRIVFATPHARFRLQAAGRYRIDVDPDRDETVVTVFAGTALMRSSAGDVRVESGGAVRVGGGSNPSFVRDRARTDAFDRWTLTRDTRWIATRTTQYVSTDMTGYEDLDSHGTWAQEPEYGAVWYPSRVSRDWAPYRHGRWDYVRPWGWTWIAEEPWGYAPYHYGRWVYVRDRWGWYPGPRTARPAWAPALVAFVGGSNFSVGISGGSAPALGWYPLAPWERYEPWYRTNATYVNRVNVIVRDGTPRQWEGRNREEWRYANRDQGATVVRRDAFLGGRSVAQDMVRVTPEAMRQVQVAQPSTVLPGPEQFRRPGRAATQPQAVPQQQAAPQPVPQATRPGAPAPAQAPQSQPPAEAPFRRAGDRSGPMARPNFGERQAAFGDRPGVPAPVPAPAQAPAAAQAPVTQQPAGAPSGRPFGRDDQRTQERAARDAQQQQREQQQAQERAAREAQQQQREQQQAQERAARDAQQAQERAAREAQQQQQQQRGAQERAAREAQQQQQQQQQAQERAAREAAQAQERAARDQQQQVQDRARAQERAAQEQAQRQQQQQQQQQQQAQERAAREAQRQQQQQQQAQERAAREAQERAAREAQQAQERAAREAQRGQPAAQQPPPGREAAPAQPAAPQPAQPTAPTRGEPARGEQARGRDKDKDKDKDKDDDDKPGKGRGR